MNEKYCGIVRNPLNPSITSWAQTPTEVRGRLAHSTTVASSVPGRSPRAQRAFLSTFPWVNRPLGRDGPRYNVTAHTRTFVRSSLCWIIWLLCLMSGVSRSSAQTGLVISEVLADNRLTIQDDFGDSSDYIEIYNGSAGSIPLTGYYLTDDPQENPQRWSFPATNIQSGEHILIWASGRDQRRPGLPLHTNFRLDRRGEQVALLAPDGFNQVYSIAFGPQAPDYSIGLTSVAGTLRTILPAANVGRFLIPGSDAVANAAGIADQSWTQPDFDDSRWNSGTGGFGFDLRSPALLKPYIRSDVAALMHGATPPRPSLFARIQFNISDLTQARNPILELRYDDGFVAYMNGTEIARSDVGQLETPKWNSVATTNRPNNAATVSRSISNSALSQSLRPGKNVLAIHGLNSAGDDGDFLIEARLSTWDNPYASNGSEFGTVGTFPTPSPGSVNRGQVTESPGSVQFSRPTGLFREPFDLNLRMWPGTPASSIYFTLDGTEPTKISAIFQKPIRITNSVQIRTRTFPVRSSPSPIQTETYLRIHPDLSNRSSDLPLITIHSFASAAFSDSAQVPCIVLVHQPKEGRASFTNAPDLVFRAGLKIRGSSTARNPKHNWSVEVWDDLGSEFRIPLLGMPSASRWVFHAPFSFDPALIRNPLAHRMSEGLGRYAPRHRFAEIFLNESPATSSDAALTAENYFGVYNIFERIGAEEDRITLHRLTAADQKTPDVTGGYLLSIEEPSVDAADFLIDDQRIHFLEPDSKTISKPARQVQRGYIADYMNRFVRSLKAPDWTNAISGYAPYIDEESWIDYHLVNLISLNNQALRRSLFFSKPRNGPLQFGPVWDFDQAFGSTGGQDINPLGWSPMSPDTDLSYFTHPWWAPLFKDPRFWQHYVDRYQELREHIFSNGSLMAVIDELSAQVTESAERDFRRWSQGKRGGTQASEIAHLKTWLKQRLYFLDTNFLSKPVVQISSRPGETLRTLQLLAPEGATIYYTLDGTDPLTPHGDKSTSARPYLPGQQISYTSDSLLIARCLRTNPQSVAGPGSPPLHSRWSGPMRWTLQEQSDLGEAPLDPSRSLVITEIHSTPLAPTEAERSQTSRALAPADFEFLELQNISEQPIQLGNARFTAGITFSFFPGREMVGPGQIILLVRDTEAFRIRYGPTPTIRGVYKGSLKPPEQRFLLELRSPQRGVLLSEEYSEGGNLLTGLAGFSITRNPIAPDQHRRQAWTVSSKVGGSPGKPNPSRLSERKVIITEVVANTPGGRSDTIELYNLTSNRVDLSHWLITDNPLGSKVHALPLGASIEPGQFRIFTQQELPSLGLSEWGETLSLYERTITETFTGYFDTFTFGTSEPFVSWGRELGTSDPNLVLPQRYMTQELANAGGQVGPLIIREVALSATSTARIGSSEEAEMGFIELQNISGQPLPLLEAEMGLVWRISGDWSYEFPSELVLAPDETIVLVSFDPTLDNEALQNIRSRFDIPEEIRILGPLVSNARAEGIQVNIEKPIVLTPDTDGAFFTVDSVHDDLRSGPLRAANGFGASLQRQRVDIHGLDPANWVAALPTPGTDTVLGIAPIILTQPLNTNSAPGRLVTLNVQGASAGPLQYQWTHDGKRIEGANGPDLTVGPLSLADLGNYSVILIGTAGSVESREAKLRSPSLSPDRGTLEIVFPPEDASIREGGQARLSVGATGLGRVSYQWYFSGAQVPGANQASLEITNLAASQFGQYHVQVRDAYSTVNSRIANIFRLEPPQFLVGPQTITALVGDSVEFEVQVAGAEPFSYRWRKVGSPQIFSNDRILRIPEVQVSHAGTYRCVVSNAATILSGLTSPAGVLTVMSDVDHDGMGDEWEVAHGFSSKTPTDGAEDSDGDGMPNAQEFRAGTDPRNPASRFAIQSIESSADGIRIGFHAAAERSYSLQYRESPDVVQWRSIVTLPGRTNEGSWTILDPFPAGSDRWYRLLTPSDYRAPLDGQGPIVLGLPKP